MNECGKNEQLLKEKLMKNYDDKSIQSLDMVQSIRKKTEVFLSSRSIKGAELAVSEILTNCNDEKNAFPFTTMEVTYDTKTRICSVKDTGRSIPLNKVKEILTNLFVGSKLSIDKNKDDIPYKRSKGSYGMGSKIVAAVSDFFTMECNRENETLIIEFENGYFKNETRSKLKDINYPHGTLVTFKLSDEVFEDTNISQQFFLEACEIMSYTTPGFDITLNLNGIKYKFLSQNGLIDLMNRNLKLKNVKPLINPIKFVFNNKGFENDVDADAEIIFTFDTVLTDNIISFINKTSCPDHGTHLSAIKSSIGRALSQYIVNNDKIPKKGEKWGVTGAIANDFLIAIISIEITNPQYENQTKSKIANKNIQPWLSSKMYSAFLNWLNANPKEADKLVKLILNVCEANWAAKQAKNKVLGITDKQNFASNSISKRLSNCLSKNPEECEVYIVEGESASVGSVRNSNNQAYYLLRGKILNVIKNKNPYNNEILMDFINMLGCGFGDKKNVDKLRYHKIIILTDADKDGQHIAALILGFLFKYYPEIIERGHVFLGNPPLMKVTTKSNKTLFIKDEKHLSFILIQMMKKVFFVYSQSTNNQIPENITEGIFYGLRDYSDIIDNYSRQLNITQELLELIILYYKDIQKHNFNIFNDKGFKVKIKEKNEYKTVIEFDEDIHHYLVTFNSSFYNEIYKPIFNKIAKDIGFYNIYLKNKETNETLSGSLYFISKFMNSLLDGKNVKESRFYKGLGEMSSEDLKVSCMDPETRLLTRITMNDSKYTDKIIQTFLGDTYQEEKKARLEKKME